MIPISDRHAAALLVALLIALVPIVQNTYLGNRFDDCADPAALSESTNIPGVIETKEYDAQHRGLRFQFTRGRLEKPSGLNNAPRYLILRTWDPSNVYMQPTYHLRGRFEADRREFEWYGEGDDAIPIYWQIGHSGRRTRIVGYLYVYDSRPVEYPFRAQLAALPRQLVHGTTPLTFFEATGLAGPQRLEEMRRSIREWLAASWSYYKEVCSE